MKRAGALALAVCLPAVPLIVAAASQGRFIREGVPASLSAEQRDTLDTALEEIRKRFRIPGLAIGILEQGSPVYARGFGVRDTRTGAPVTEHTLFHAASISKTLTATAVLQLAEDGRLGLADRVERYLPDFEGSRVTLAQLLTHSAGLSDWWHASGASDDAAVASYIAKVARHEPAYPPGQGWEYSDADFNVLGAVIESVSGEAFPDYMAGHVLEPAGMTESTFRQPSDGAEIAWPHRGKLFVHRAAEQRWDRVFLPSSGLQTSVTDLLRWAAVNLERDPRLLSAASYEALFTRRIGTAWPGIAMGIGWQLERRGGEWLPRHPGGEHGFRALLTLYPKQRRAIVILSNGETTPRIAIRSVIEAALANAPVVLPEPPRWQRRSTQWIALVAVVALIVLAVTLLWRRRSRL